LVLVSGYATPDRLRRVGRARLAAWLRARHVRSYAQLADRAVTAAGTQHVALPGQEITAAIVSELASSVLALDARITDVDAQIAATFELHPQAAIIVSMPGFGPFLGASPLAAAGDLRAFPSAGHLAAAAGLVPVPNDSGRRSGNLGVGRRRAAQAPSDHPPRQTGSDPPRDLLTAPQRRDGPPADAEDPDECRPSDAETAGSATKDTASARSIARIDSPPRHIPHSRSCCSTLNPTGPTPIPTSTSTSSSTCTDALTD